MYKSTLNVFARTEIVGMYAHVNCKYSVRPCSLYRGEQRKSGGGEIGKCLFWLNRSQKGGKGRRPPLYTFMFMIIA